MLRGEFSTPICDFSSLMLLPLRQGSQGTKVNLIDQVLRVAMEVADLFEFLGLDSSLRYIKVTARNVMLLDCIFILRGDHYRYHSVANGCTFASVNSEF